MASPYTCWPMDFRSIAGEIALRTRRSSNGGVPALTYIISIPPPGSPVSSASGLVRCLASTSCGESDVVEMWR